MKNDGAEVIIIHETVLKSWARDVGVFATYGCMIGIGWLLDSTALQWVGAIIAFIVIGTRASGYQKKFRMSIPQARAKLDDLEGVA